MMTLFFIMNMEEFRTYDIVQRFRYHDSRRPCPASAYLERHGPTFDLNFKTFTMPPHSFPNGTQLMD